LPRPIFCPGECRESGAAFFANGGVTEQAPLIPSFNRMAALLGHSFGEVPKLLPDMNCNSVEECEAALTGV
jgi:hypothetical protein